MATISSAKWRARSNFLLIPADHICCLQRHSFNGVARNNISHDPPIFWVHECFNLVLEFIHDAVCDFLFSRHYKVYFFDIRVAEANHFKRHRAIRMEAKIIWMSERLSDILRPLELRALRRNPTDAVIDRVSGASGISLNCVD